MSDSLSQFFAEADAPDRTLAIVGREHPGPIRDLFADAFGRLDIDLEEIETDPEDDSTVVLTGEDGVIATSPMETIKNTILLVNSDLYTTGLSGIEKYEAPSVLTELDEAVYTLRGFPQSTKEKLLLIVMSRFIERRALETGDGRLDVAFQQLSRIRDEYGTGRIYERLSESDVEVHAYGVPDVTNVGYDGITVHSGRAERYQRSWFVVFTPADGGEPAALVAVETNQNVWRAMWSYDPGRVDSIQQHIIDQF